MSDTEIWGPCGHNSLDFAGYAAGALDDGNEVHAVEGQAVACATCSDELGDHLEIARLINGAVDIATASALLSGQALGPNHRNEPHQQQDDPSRDKPRRAPREVGDNSTLWVPRTVTPARTRVFRAIEPDLARTVPSPAQHDLRPWRSDSRT